MNERSTDPILALRALANRWTMLAREYARDAKASAEQDPRGHFNRGLAEGYYKAAVDLAELLKAYPELIIRATGPLPVEAPPPAGPTPTPPPSPAASAAAPAQPPKFVPMNLNEVLDILAFAGTNPREVRPNAGVNTFTAIFSRWEPLMPHERVALLQKADYRLVIVESGKIRDTSDPFVEFGFRAT